MTLILEAPIYPRERHLDTLVPDVGSATGDEDDNNILEALLEENTLHRRDGVVVACGVTKEMCLLSRDS